MCKLASERESQDEYHLANTRKLFEAIRGEIVPINCSRTNGVYQYTTKTSLEAQRVSTTQKGMSIEIEGTVICDGVTVLRVSHMVECRLRGIFNGLSRNVKVNGAATSIE